MRFVCVAAVAAALAGCAAGPSQWRAESVPVLLVPSEPAGRRDLRQCPPLPQSVMAEMRRETPIAELRKGGAPDLAAALVASEMRKNAELGRTVGAYESCRRKKAPATIGRAGA